MFKYGNSSDIIISLALVIFNNKVHHGFLIFLNGVKWRFIYHESCNFKTRTIYLEKM